MAAEAEAPGRCPSPESPTRRGRFASPEVVAAAEAAAVEGAAEAALRLRQNCRPGSKVRCSTGISRAGGTSVRMS